MVNGRMQLHETCSRVAPHYHRAIIITSDVLTDKWKLSVDNKDEPVVDPWLQS